MCSCPLHNNRNGVDVCTCLCQEHDQFFDQGVVLVRQAVRRYQRVAQDEIKGIHNRLNAVNELYNETQARLSRLQSRLETVEERQPADPDFVNGIAASVDRIIDRVDAIEERLSPPESLLAEDQEPLLSEHAPEYDAAMPLPPHKWDQFGVQWSAFWENGRMYWKADTQAGRLVLAHKDEALRRRGPFTSKSPLAEDQPSERDEMIEKMAAIMSEVEHPHGSGKSRFGRSYTDRLAEAVYDFVLADRDVTSPENDEDDEDGEWVNLHAFVPGTASPEKCDACGGPADGVLHEQPRGSGLWSEPWEPQFSDEDTDVLSIAIRQAVGAASACWQNLKGAGVFDDQKALWVASGLQRWIESRYQLFDQPAYAAKVSPHADRETATAWSAAFDAMSLPEDQPVTFSDEPPEPTLTKETKERLHSESDRKSCMSCHTSPVDCDRSRTYNSEACCQFCEVETFKVAHPVKKTTKSEETSDGREHETDADSYMPLGTDPTLWAKEFLRVFHHGRVGSIPDEGTLIGWFANAIEAGRSAEYQTYVANADRIRLAKDALMFSGYFEESDLTDDEIAPRIRELISAHNSGFFAMKGDLDRQIVKWKDRALVAERRMSSIRQFVQDNLRVTQDEE